MSDEELIARLRTLGRDFDDWDTAADRIEALSAERDAARQDAKAAEDELEMQEQEACMTEDDYIKLEKERDALEAKLAKVVAAAGKMLDVFCVHEDSHQSSAYEAMCAALAETERESHDPL